MKNQTKNKGTKINHLSNSDGEGCKVVGAFFQDGKWVKNR